MLDTTATYTIYAALAVFLYTYAGYPSILWAVGLLRRGDRRTSEPSPWPSISITVPAYNEEAQIADTIESLLALDYPQDRRQILIVSDASTDRTDEIVRSYADRGVELLRMPERGGKTAAENAAAERLTGEIVVNTDASIRILPDSLKPLIRPFADPEVGLASGRDVSVSRVDAESNTAESGYVGYEMKVRDLETLFFGIVGASGCFYAIRAALHRIPLPEALSRDFAAALNVTERGFRAVSVSEAPCLVPRAPSIKKEYHRKVRTMTRGMETLWFKRALLNPLRYGRFAWMLFSHKVMRWMVPWAGLAAFLGLGVLAPAHPAAGWLFILAAALAGLGVISWSLSDRVSLPRPFVVLAFLVMGNVAALHSTLRALQGEEDPTWEPTRRDAKPA